VFGESGDAAFGSSRLYLVNKLLVALNVVLILSAISGLAITAIRGWDAFMPPQELRDAIVRLDNQLSAERPEQQRVSGRVQQLEAEWSAQGKTIIEKYQTERKQKSASALAENAALEKTLDEDSSARQPIQAVKKFLSLRDGGESVVLFNRARQEAVEFIERIAPESKQEQLKHYVDNWHVDRSMQLEIREMSEDKIRSDVQRDYKQLKAQAGVLEQGVRRDETQLAELRSQVNYSGPGLLWALAQGLGTFIVTVVRRQIKLDRSGLFVRDTSERMAA
jgi:hypothetical protein